MAFSQTAITSGPFFRRVGADLVVSWTSTATAGTWYQVYVNGALQWFGTETRVTLPWPSSFLHVDVGTVGAGEGSTDFSGTLPTQPLKHARLEWDGGLWESPDLAGYSIYQSPSAGASIDYSEPVAMIPFQTGPSTYGGYGRGGYGEGGYGTGDAHFTWTSGVLSNGVWQFAVAPFDVAGNIQSSHLTCSVTVAGAPRPPAPNAAGLRLTYTLSGTTPTLHWLASP